MIARVVEHVDFQRLQLRHDRGVVFFTGGDRVNDDRLQAIRVECFCCFSSKTGSIGRLVVENGNILALVLSRNESTSDFALHVVTTDDAEDRRTSALVRELHVGRRRRDHDRAFFSINLRRGD